jgi:serine/threonine protein phosphatase PrpC
MTMTDCASCADERAAGAAFCEACGNPLNAAPPAAAPPAASPAPAAAGACPHCGATGTVGADGYCEQCGLLATRPRDHIEIDLGPVAASVTDRGLRHHRNEDAMWLVARGTAVDVVVCDGVSSSYDPDVASETAVNAAGAVLSGEVTPASPAPGEDLQALTALVGSAITGATAAVAELAHDGDPRRAASNPACTIVAAVVRGAHVGFGWVGDSRAYWLPADGPAVQLTEDDSWVTHAIALGADPEAALRDPKAHAITAWLGADAGPITPRTGAFTVSEPGHLILCSDGLWNYLPDPASFAGAVRARLTESTLVGTARDLAEFANLAGGADNITVALIPVPVDPAVKEHGL